MALPRSTCINIFGWNFFSLCSNLQDRFPSFGNLIRIYSRNSFLIILAHLHSKFCDKRLCPATGHTNFRVATSIYFLCILFNSPLQLTTQISGDSLKLQNSRIVCIPVFPRTGKCAIILEHILKHFQTLKSFRC